MRVRAAVPADAPALAEMVAALAAHHGDAATASAESLARHLFAPGADAWVTALVAERWPGGGAPLGYTVMFRAPRVAQAVSAAVVEHLYVAPAARGRGVGGALLDAARDYGRAWGCAELAVAAHARNAEAQRFYERRGMVGRPRTGVAYRQALE